MAKRKQQHKPERFVVPAGTACFVKLESADEWSWHETEFPHEFKSYHSHIDGVYLFRRLGWLMDVHENHVKHRDGKQEQKTPRVAVSAWIPCEIMADECTTWTDFLTQSPHEFDCWDFQGDAHYYVFRCPGYKMRVHYSFVTHRSGKRK